MQIRHGDTIPLSDSKTLHKVLNFLMVSNKGGLKQAMYDPNVKVVLNDENEIVTVDDKTYSILADKYMDDMEAKGHKSPYRIK